MTAHVTLEAALQRETGAMAPADRKRCEALLAAIRHLQNPEARGHLPDKFIAVIDSWYSRHEFDAERTPEMVRLQVAYYTGLKAPEVNWICRQLKLRAPRSGKLVRKLSTERPDTREATAFTVVAKLLKLKESWVRRLNYQKN